MESEPPPGSPALHVSCSLFFLIGVDLTLVFLMLLLLVLLLFSALLSGSEVAFFSLKAPDIDEIKQKADSPSKKIIDLLSSPDRLLATILVANNVVNVAIILLSDLLLRRVLGMEQCEAWARGLSRWMQGAQISVTIWAKAIHYGITVVLVTFLLVLFGEVLPKVYSKIYNKNMALRMSGPLMILYRLFKPITSLMKGLSKRIQGSSLNSSITSKKEELDRAIELTTNQNDVKSLRQKDIMKSLINFNEVIVKEVMKSRLDMIAVEATMDFAEVLEVVKSCGYSRIPVYEGELDEIVGILYVKDLLPYLDRQTQYQWTSIVRTEVFYTPETKRIHELLEEFRESRMHLAIVVDEYGGTSGIITLEDVLEEVIGDIKDEFDDDAQEIQYAKISANQYIFEGKTLLKDVYKVMDLPSDEMDAYKGESDSIAGLFVEILGRIPRSKEIIRIGSILLTAYAVDARRIKKVMITLR